MENEELKPKITILPHTPSQFIIPWNGKFNVDLALQYGGIMGGECYDQEGFDKLSQNKPSKPTKTGNNTAKSEHSTTHEHINIGLELVNYPKIVAMTLNNERQMVTSEKSARYTTIKASIDPEIGMLEEKLYNDWIHIFIGRINQKYPGMFTEIEAKKKAQENARYMVTCFASTKMNHTVPLVQLNREVRYMMDYCNLVSQKQNPSSFELRLSKWYVTFIDQLDELGLLDERLQSNKKGRKLSIFGDRVVNTEFGENYSISYQTSIASFAQSHRHRTIDHNMLIDLEHHEFYVPEIIKGDKVWEDMWLDNIASVGYYIPQGKLVTVNERGTMEALFMKAQERRCASAQLEIDIQTRKTLELAAMELEAKDHPYAEKAKQLVLGPRCTCGYPCDNKGCKFPGTKDNGRLI